MGLVPSLKFHISAPANQKNWEDDPVLFEILPIFQGRLLLVSGHVIQQQDMVLDWRSNLLQWIRPFHGCLQRYNLLTHIGSLSFAQKFQGPKINSSTHWKLKKITAKSLKSKLQWPHRRRSLAWLSSMRLGHHQWCRIQNSLQPQGPPDLTQGIPCHDGVVCLSHKKRLPRLCPSFTKKSSKSRVMAPKRKAQRSDSPGNDETEESFQRQIAPGFWSNDHLSLMHDDFKKLPFHRKKDMLSDISIQVYLVNENLAQRPAKQ